MNLLKTHKPNLEYVTQGLLKQLGVKVNARSIAQSLQDHPHYPSLLAISDCLNDWCVENQNYNIPRAEYDRDDLLFPFLAHLKEDGGRFILILNIADDKVYYADEKNNHAEITEAEFLNRWDGIALHAEKTGKSGEKEYKQNQLKYFLQSLILPLGLLIALSGFYLAIIATGFSWPFLLMNLVKLGGVAHKTNTDVNRYRLSWPCVKGRQNLQKGKKYYEKVKIKQG